MNKFANGYVETIYMNRFESEVKAIRLKMDSISGKEEEKNLPFLFRNNFFS